MWVRSPRPVEHECEPAGLGFRVYDLGFRV
jgi:hypothetical protein